MITFLIIYAVLLIWSVYFLTIRDYAYKKGYEGFKVSLKAIVPVYGYLYFKKKEVISFLEEDEIKYAFSKELFLKRIAISAIIVLLALLIMIPIFGVAYLSIKNNTMRSITLIYSVILILLVHQGTVVEYADKKGYIGTTVGVIGLIPIYGFIHYARKEKRRNASKSAIRNVFSISNFLKRILIYAEISLMAIIVVVPVIYIFGMAFSNLRSDVPNQIWPEKPSWDAFVFLFKETKFIKWYKNTLIIALINMVIGTVLITGASYVFARFNFKGKKAGLLTILVLQAFPSFMGLIAMYVLFWKFGLLGKPTALSILYIGGSIPGNLWLIKGFLSQIPKDLDESAMIDGASKIKIFTKIILPLSIPILTFVAVSMFMGPWMDYMLPGYLLNFMPSGAEPGYDVQNQWTLAVGIFNFINDVNNINYSAFAAAALIVGVPIAILYMVFQKYLIEGIMSGATKG